MDRRWEIPSLRRLAVSSDRIYHRKSGSGGQENHLNFRVFSVGGKAPARQGCRLPAIPPGSRATTELPAIIGHLGLYFAHNRAKIGNGEFRRIYWQTARECGSVAMSRGRGITRNSRIWTRSVRVPQRFLGPSVESARVLQHTANHCESPGVEKAVASWSLPATPATGVPTYFSNHRSWFRRITSPSDHDFRSGDPALTFEHDRDDRHQVDFGLKSW